MPQLYRLPPGTGNGFHEPQRCLTFARRRGRLPSNVTHFKPKNRNTAELVGRTPWSARVPLDPLLALIIKRLRHRDRPTGASAADQGGRPAGGRGGRRPGTGAPPPPLTQMTP